jgi:hypothetical protein
MIKGYFPHKLPDAIPSAFGFAYVLGMLGLNTDPTFDAVWLKTSHIRRGIYQRPIVNSTDDAFHHSAFLIQLCNYNNPTWNDMPLLLNILVPNLDLTFINTWVTQITNALHPKEKPLLFTTLQHWIDLQKGPNAEVVSKTILQKADIMISQYRVSLPSKALYVDKLKYWEFENGKMQYAPDGVFERVIPAVVSEPPPADENPYVPPADQLPATSKDVNIHLFCPKCNQKIF